VKARYFYMLALGIAGADQCSKLYVTLQLPYGCSRPIIGDLAYITPWQNSGGAFGLFQSSTLLLTLISAAAIIALVVAIRRGIALPAVAGIALSMQFGGALGNLIDRVRLHYVIDFIDLRIWPIFNVADSAITVGMVLLIYYLLFCDGHRRKAAADTSAKE
jgi:signal peptidase II